MTIRLNESNYFSTEADSTYLSASQIKRFLECEAMALAEIRGEYKREETAALLVGGYVDAYFSRSLDVWVSQHPQILTQKGTLRAEFQQAQEIIAYIENDPLLMAMSRGDLQVISTGEINGFPFKCKVDVLLDEAQCKAIAQDFPEMAEHLLMAPGAIVDWKIMRDMEPAFVPGAGRVSFIQAWRYDLQMAIYQRRIGSNYPCFLLVATKEKVPDKALIHIPQYMLDAAWASVEEQLPRFQHLKSHPGEAVACGKCEWCRQVKKLTGAIEADELEGALL